MDRNSEHFKALQLLLLIIILCFFFATVSTASTSSCETEHIVKRAKDSEVVIAGYTRAVFSNDSTTDYSAEFLVFNVFKGEDIVQKIFDRRKPSALESALTRRLLNVSHFGQCPSEVKVGETYFLFLSSNSDQNDNLSSDASEPYSREKEELIFEGVGGHSWSEWSPCSGTCGGGIQQRRRFCNTTITPRCSSEDGQQRTCNTFPCSGVFDALDAAGLRKSLMHPADRTTAYRLLPKNSWRSEDQVVLPRTFPWEFSLLVFFRSRTKAARNENPLSAPMSLGGFLLRILVDDNFQAGLHIDDRSLSLVLSADDNVRVSYDHDGGLTDGRWHALAVAVRRDAATFFVDCRPASSLPVRARLRPFAGRPVTVIVGSLGKRDPHAFQGDVEQLVISESPSASAEQCSRITQPLVSRSQGLPLKEEVRRPSQNSVLSGPQSDQQTYRGDILIEDDEDFAFGDEIGSGTNALDNDPKTGQEEVKKGIPLISENDETDGDDEYNDYADDIDDDDKKEYETTDNSDEEPEEGSGAHPNADAQWSDWSSCSRTCDWGIRTRTLYCSSNVLSIKDCAPQNAERKQTETCFLGICPTSTASTTTASNVSISVTSFASTTKMTTWGAVSTKPPCRIKCQNGGTCKRPNTCLCTSGYYGKFCQYAICKPVCRNGALCSAPNKCQCKSGFSGIYCEKPVCRFGCKNGGRCIAPDRCACPSGYSGNDCGTPRCYPSCYNGGQCVKPYSCHCPPSTRGAFCEKFVCWPQCRNGGVCAGPGKCSCPRGFCGRFCEETYCPDGCENGGRCGKTGKCSSPPGFHGQRCEMRKCFFVEVKEPYKRGYKRKIITKEQVPCGAWGWKQCTKTKVHYETVFKTFYRTAYRCDEPTKNILPIKKLKSIYSKARKWKQETSNET